MLLSILFATFCMAMSYVVVVVVMALQPFVGPWRLFQFLDLIHSR
jgi:hypothetical protein